MKKKKTKDIGVFVMFLIVGLLLGLTFYLGYKFGEVNKVCDTFGSIVDDMTWNKLEVTN